MRADLLFDGRIVGNLADCKMFGKRVSEAPLSFKFLKMQSNKNKYARDRSLLNYAKVSHVEDILLQSQELPLVVLPQPQICMFTFSHYTIS